MAIYGVDVASYQRYPDWPRVHAAGIRFAFSKVSEGTGYINPTWNHNRSGMLGLGDDFLPGAYHFLTGGGGASQARYFVRHAGDLTKFAVALDVEAKGADAATSRAFVAEFKKITGGHPVIGYYPRWYWERTGRPDLDFFDAVWQSRYVSGSGTAPGLYAKVPPSFWASFGGEPISILQYSSSATVPGITGRCDVNAYRGSLDELRAIALGEDDMPTAKEIADAIWSHNIPASWMPPGGDNMWQADTHLGVAHAHIRSLENMVAGLASKLDVALDPEAVARAVLAGLTPATIAAAVVDELPEELARQVVDELAGRLGSGPSPSAEEST